MRAIAYPVLVVVLSAFVPSLPASAGGDEAAAPAAVSSPAAIAAGKVIFQQRCTACHGKDGKAQIDLISDATNLTVPGEYYHGSDDQAIYKSITSGAGKNMPGFKDILTDAERWQLVHFIKSLWP